MRGKIGVWGHFHGGNIGDDIVVATLIANVRQRAPDHEIFAFSLNPADTVVRHGVPAGGLDGGPILPVDNQLQADVAHTASDHTEKSSSEKTHSGLSSRAATLLRELGRAWLPARLHPGGRVLRDLLRTPSLWRRLRGFDAIFVAGSGPVFDDMGGPWAHPYNLLRWSLTCRLAGTKFCLMNVGAGPIHSPLSRRFLSWSLAAASYLSFRDEASVDIATMLGVRQARHRNCDMAFALPEAHLEMARSSALQAPCPLVGIAPMAYMDSEYWPNADASIQDRYVDALAKLSIWLLSENYNLVLLKSQRHADERTASVLLARMRELSPGLDEERILNPETCGHQDLLRFMAGCATVVGGRFHCHVLPFVLGIPVLGVSYHPKTDQLMQQMNQSEYFLSMDQVTGEELIESFQRLQRNRIWAAAEIRRQSAGNRQMLDRQFDEIVSLRFLDS